MLSRNKKLDNEKSVYSRIQDQIKLSSFQIINETLRIEESSMWFAVTLALVEYL